MRWYECRFRFIAALIMTLLLLGLQGCAASLNTSAAHPINQVTQTEQQLHGGLITINLISVVIAALGAGLFVYGAFTTDKAEESLGELVGTGATLVALVSLTGLFVLPFAPYILLGLIAIALAAGGYVVYVRYFKKITSPVVDILTKK